MPINAYYGIGGNSLLEDFECNYAIASLGYGLLAIACGFGLVFFFCGTERQMRH
ncbi:hypothetical protein [Tolypothrix sp. NIES-4075]|uniref:hypothetical protein n=1 Tax=Tolypothrix sp. NIES-4075 TaxID=2005459 RepID=UPI0013577EAB|nr:hypothetical protein [Tolypothrix sp. NIES-4075]